MKKNKFGVKSKTSVFFSSNLPQQLSTKVIEHFSQRVCGKTVWRGASEYESFWQSMIWNGRKYPRFPELIVQAHSEADIIETINFARAHHLKVSIRGSGHHYSGCFLRNGGILLDLSLLQDMEVNTQTREIKVSPGVTSGLLNARLAQVGLAFPTGHSKNVGISGFLLGGGVGVNSVAWGGMSVFNVKALDIIMADGKPRHVNVNKNPDLYWAACGGGPGLFFVVTRFYLRCYPLPNSIRMNTYTMRFSELREVVQAMEEVSSQIDPSLQVMLAIVPAHQGLVGQCTHEDYGRVAVLNTIAFASEVHEAQLMQEPLAQHPIFQRALKKDLDQSTTIEDIYQQGDASLHAQRYAVDNILTDRLDEAIQILTRYLPTSPSEATMPLIMWRGNHMVFPDIAYSARGRYCFTTCAQWNEADHDEVNRSWLKSLYDELNEIASGSYVNEFNTETRDPRACYLKEHWDKLQQLRQQHDPEGVFHDFYCGQRERIAEESTSQFSKQI